jgi:hypothetical protein
MKTTFYRLFVIPPNGSRCPKIHFSRPAALTLAAALVLSFLATVAVMLIFPGIPPSDIDRSRVAAENQTLKIENRNAEFQMRRLNAQVARVEELSNQVTALIDSD